MNKPHLSHDKQRLALLQRERRARMVRIDYMPERVALGIFRALQATKRPGSLAATNSAVLDAIVTEWAALTGINKAEVVATMSSDNRPELCDPKRARAYDFGNGLPPWATDRLEAQRQACVLKRNPCGARRHRDGLPCRALSEPGNRRCRFHGGRSTGPRTQTGKERALRNLKQYKGSPKV